MSVAFRLADRDDRKFKFNIAYYEFLRNWTCKSREDIAEFEEIRSVRLKSAEDKIEDLERLNSNADNLSMDIQIVSIKEYFKIVVSLFEDELVILIDRLNQTNIYMNKSIMEIISKYEKILEDELKSLSDLIVPICFEMREITSAYSIILNKHVKFDVDNPHKRLQKFYTDHFENRYSILLAAHKTISDHLDIIYKREEKINTEARKWARKEIVDLRKSERQRLGMVFEETRKYSEQSLNVIRNLLEPSD